MQVVHQCTWQKTLKWGEEFFLSDEWFYYLKKKKPWKLGHPSRASEYFSSAEIQPRCSITQVCFERGNKETNFCKETAKFESN